MKAILFDVDNFERVELDAMSAEERLELAVQSEMLDETAMVMDVENFSNMVNNGEDNFTNSWLYFY